MAKQTEFDHPPFGHVAILGYDSADDHWQAIYVDDLGRLQIDIAASETIAVTAPGGDRIFNFETVVADNVQTDATTTTLVISSTAVPTGKVWVITNIATRNLDGDVPTRTEIYLNHNGTDVTVDQLWAALAQLQFFTWQGSICLDAGDYIKGVLVGVAAPETGQLTCLGYQMDAPG